MYLLFGVGTTLISFGVFVFLDAITGGDYYLIANLVAFMLATIFAFITSKIFVFESRSWKVKTVVREALSFLNLRVLTFLMEEFGLLFAVAGLKADEFWLLGLNGKTYAKVILAVIAVVLNYIFSKRVIFKKRLEEDKDESSARNTRI